MSYEYFLLSSNKHIKSVKSKEACEGQYVSSVGIIETWAT